MSAGFARLLNARPGTSERKTLEGSGPQRTLLPRRPCIVMHARTSRSVVVPVYSLAQYRCDPMTAAKRVFSSLTRFAGFYRCLSLACPWSSVGRRHRALVQVPTQLTDALPHWTGFADLRS